jgi:hypothetical protein
MCRICLGKYDGGATSKSKKSGHYKKEEFTSVWTAG